MPAHHSVQMSDEGSMDGGRKGKLPRRLRDNGREDPDAPATNKTQSMGTPDPAVCRPTFYPR